MKTALRRLSVVQKKFCVAIRKTERYARLRRADLSVKQAARRRRVARRANVPVKHAGGVRTDAAFPVRMTETRRARCLFSFKNF